MALEIVPAKAEYMASIIPQSEQVAEVGNASLEDWLRVVEASRAWCGLRDGVALAAGGLCSQWPGRSAAWLLIDRRCGPTDVLSIARKSFEEIEMAIDGGCRRIETTVRRGFAPGIRLVRLLRMEYEGTLRAYGPDGADHLMYARVA